MVGLLWVLYWKTERFAVPCRCLGGDAVGSTAGSDALLSRQDAAEQDAQSGGQGGIGFSAKFVSTHLCLCSVGCRVWLSVGPAQVPLITNISDCL